MQNLFHLLSPVGQGLFKSAEWLYVRDGLKRNLGTVIRFYRGNPMAVQSSHFLVKLLHSINVPQSQNLERYFSNVDAMALNMSMALKMTSSIYQGQLFPGIFYGTGSKEILVAHSESFDIFLAHRNWQNLCPIRVLRHDQSDLNLRLPTGDQANVENGLAVVSINIPMLAIMYRAFRLNEMMITSEQDNEKSIMQFIHMYVLPNMLFSHLDYAIFNRINNQRKGAPMGEAKQEHSFYLTDFSKRVDDQQKEMLHQLAMVGKDFAGILQSVQTVTKNSLEDTMLLPDMAPTRQVIWALVLARLPALHFLFTVLRDGPGKRNQSEINNVLRNFRMYHSDNLMRSMLPLDVFYDVQSDIHDITNPFF